MAWSSHSTWHRNAFPPPSRPEFLWSSETPRDVSLVLLGISLVFEPHGEKTRELAQLACPFHSLWLLLLSRCCYWNRPSRGCLEFFFLPQNFPCVNSTLYQPVDTPRCTHMCTYTAAFCKPLHQAVWVLAGRLNGASSSSSEPLGVFTFSGLEWHSFQWIILLVSMILTAPITWKPEVYLPRVLLLYLYKHQPSE